MPTRLPERRRGAGRADIAARNRCPASIRDRRCFRGRGERGEECRDDEEIGGGAVGDGGRLKPGPGWYPVSQVVLIFFALVPPSLSLYLSNNLSGVVDAHLAAVGCCCCRRCCCQIGGHSLGRVISRWLSRRLIAITCCPWVFASLLLFSALKAHYIRSSVGGVDSY